MCVPGCREAVRRAMSRRGFFKGAATAGFAVFAATPARAQRNFTSVIDLTHTLSASFPTFLGTPDTAAASPERREACSRR